MANSDPQAVIDLGTNTLILLIATPLKKGLKVLHDQAVVTRLGEGIAEDHFFKPEAMNRTLSVLKDFKKTCTQLKVKKIKAIGTAGFRNAMNAEVFIEKVKEACGFQIEIISGEEEAELVYTAAAADFSKEYDQFLVIDIGGGSTEVIQGPIEKSKKKNSTPPLGGLISLAMGSVKLSENYIRSDPISAEDYEKLVTGIRQHLARGLDPLYPDGVSLNDTPLIATAGTATTLATLALKLKKYDPEKVHGSILTKHQLEGVLEQIVYLTVEERRKIPGLEPLRADVILAGGLLLRELMNYFEKKEVIISDRGLRYGIMRQWLKL